MNKKFDIPLPDKRKAWWDKPTGTDGDSRAANDYGWLLSEILVRWYQGMSHLTRARMLVFGAIDTHTGLDLDANWKLAVIDFFAAVDAWSKLPEVMESPVDFEMYRLYRHSIAHILIDSSAHVTVSETPLGLEASKWVSPITHKGDHATGECRFPNPGISQGFFRQCISIADTLAISPLACLMFDFWDDQLSQHPEFQFALDELTRRVESSYDFDPSFMEHVLGHRLPVSTCDYCFDADRRHQLAPKVFIKS